MVKSGMESEFGSAVLRFFMGGGALTSDVMLRFCQGRQPRDECTMLSGSRTLPQRRARKVRIEEESPLHFLHALGYLWF
jgi:hypothetical protein